MAKKLHGTRLRRDQGLLIAPLLDIMFLVLLFFLFNVNFSALQSYDIKLPDAKNPDNPAPSERLIVTVLDNNSYLLNNRPIAASRLSQELNQIIKETKNSQVLLLGAENIAYNRLIQAMDAIRAAGAAGISLGVNKE